MKFNDERLRISANLQQYYMAWRDTVRAQRLADYSLSWMRKGDVDYLRKRQGSLDTSLGVRSADTEQLLSDHLAHKSRLAEDETAQGQVLQDACRQYCALGMGVIASAAAGILREADLRGYLDGALMVVGTNALPAYELEAGARFARGMDATEDFDMAWVAQDRAAMVLASRQPVNLLGMLKSIDSTYTVNTERTFQARNRGAYEVELLVAPSRAGSLPRTAGLSPIPLPEQEWLLQGQPVDRVVCGLDKSPARIVAPDPRRFALHKLWMADKPDRNPLKRPKDRRQGLALLENIATQMPQYPLDEGFMAELPVELREYLQRWLLGVGRDLHPARTF